MNDNHDLHDERISNLYRMGNDAEPSTHLDAQIKQAAHDAVAKKRRSYAWPSLATAAVLVLSFSLVLKVLEQKPLAESIMQPTSEMDSSVQPNVILQEDVGTQQKPAQAFQDMQGAPQLEQKTIREKAKAGLRKAMPVPETRINKAEETKRVQSPPAPTGALDPATDAEMAAPAEGGGITSAFSEKHLNCNDANLPDTDSSDEWIEQYQQAIKHGHTETADCIKQAFSRKFGRGMPEHIEQ